MGKEKYVLGFDADDTLWVNEVYYQEAEHEFCRLLSVYNSAEEISEKLFNTEMQNLKIYGFGTKGFMLSMIETALKLSKQEVSQKVLDNIIQIGKNMLNKPVVLLEGVKNVLEILSSRGYRLILATKGDMIDQQRKLKMSGIETFFDHIEIMSNKSEADYLKLLSHLNLKANNFLMTGNSVKSDIIPVINIGANAIHIPYHTTWQHEEIKGNNALGNFKTLNNISELLDILDL